MDVVDLSEHHLELSDVGEILSDTLLPFYKLFPEIEGQSPVFRRSLTGEEAQNLLTTMYHLVVLIKTQERQAA